MHVPELRRAGTATVAMLALMAAVAGCSDDGSSAGAAAPSPTTSAPTDQVSGAGAETFGEGCDSIPTRGAGSFEKMAQSTAGLAVGHTPALKTLSSIIGATGLSTTLDDDQATYTIFAPSDQAFKTIPKSTLASLMQGAEGRPTSPLGQILLHHVLTQRSEPTDLVGEKTTANEDKITVEGDTNGMTVSDGETVATVLCGNIQTTNATIYIIDHVLSAASVRK